MSQARSQGRPGKSRSKLRAYQELAKSGIVTLVLISVFGGYLIGHPFEQHLNGRRLIATLLGVLFLASGSSAWNQWQDREMDARMPRTAGRPLPSGKLSPREVAVFIVVSILLGLVILFRLDPRLLALGVAALVSYNGLYTLWWKRHWSFAAIPGAVPGALPILMGYASASGRVGSLGGIYLFAMLFFWQMPHFWVLALRYRSDYERGEVPTLPVTHGPGITVAQIRLWCLAYVALALGAPIFLHVGAVYLVASLLMSVKVLWELFQFGRAPETMRWLHFFLWVNFSLIVYLAAAAADLWSVYLIPYFA